MTGNNLFKQIIIYINIYTDKYKQKHKYTLSLSMSMAYQKGINLDDNNNNKSEQEKNQRQGYDNQRNKIYNTVIHHDLPC